MTAMHKRLVLAALLGLALASPAAANTCVDLRKIDSSKSTDGKTMVFKMKDGTTLVNHLKGICSDLKFNGFAWRTHSGASQVCENEDSFQVLQSGQICVLGKFDPATATVWDANRQQAPR